MKFEVGDRVRVYDRSIHIDAEIKVINDDGVFIQYYRNGNQNQQGPFHPKQCRKLVKKKKTRKTVWVRYDVSAMVPTKVVEQEPEERKKLNIFSDFGWWVKFREV